MPIEAQIDSSTLGAILALLVLPALLVLALPRRWLGRGMLAWLVAPLVVYCALMGWEALTRPTVTAPLATAFYGLALIAPLLAPPWLIGSGLGFGLGFLLRRLRPASPLPIPPARAPNAPWPPVAWPPAPWPLVPQAVARPRPVPAVPDHAGWHFWHIGFEKDGLMIGGRSVWGQTWRETGQSPALLPHPAHPAQVHAYDIRQFGDPSDPVHFAVAELSNGVWGFWVPDQAEDSRLVKISPDGRLRVDLEPIEWSNAHWVNSAVVTERPGGRILLDLRGTDWDALPAFPSPGQVGLRLASYRTGTEIDLLIDQTRDRFRLLEGPDRQAIQPEALLSTIQNALAEASARRRAALNLPPSLPPKPFAAWRSALVILGLALLAIGVIAALARPDTSGLRIVPMATIPKPPSPVAERR